jgi:hypothetical protein
MCVSIHKQPSGISVNDVGVCVNVYVCMHACTCR